MKQIFKLAWRNIWRNKRRTLITAASVFFAVLFASSMKSLQAGAWNEMIKNVTSLHIGYAQIHAAGFWENRSIDKSLSEEDILQQLNEVEPEGLVGYLPRLESFALASSGDKSGAVLVVGADLEKEEQHSELSSRLVEGRLLEKGEPGVILAEGLAKKLNLGLQDSLILSSIGYHAASAVGLYPIKGIISFNNPELDKQF
jgi:putative ABC transport system permease protein